VRAIVLATTVLLLLPLASFASASVPAGCSAAPLEVAARELVHEGAEVVAVDELGAILSLPIVYPAVRERMLDANGLWCTTGAYNAPEHG
jgi:hypothetical protein